MAEIIAKMAVSYMPADCQEDLTGSGRYLI